MLQLWFPSTPHPPTPHPIWRNALERRHDGTGSLSADPGVFFFFYREAEKKVSKGCFTDNALRFLGALQVLSWK